MLIYQDKTVTILKAEEKERLAEEKMEEQRLRDILLLLENLFQREETTIKMVLDCLYDIGSKNLINKKIRSRPLNKFMKSIAGMSKPIFRIVALRWFQSKCPQLIADWLRSKVSF
jgi:chromosome condensin MukBEF complex kleisin-like MukF subunit